MSYEITADPRRDLCLRAKCKHIDFEKWGLETVLKRYQSTRQQEL